MGVRIPAAMGLVRVSIPWRTYRQSNVDCAIEVCEQVGRARRFQARLLPHLTSDNRRRHTPHQFGSGPVLAERFKHAGMHRGARDVVKSRQVVYDAWQSPETVEPCDCGSLLAGIPLVA